jgi:hypothetical protein
VIPCFRTELQNFKIEIVCQPAAVSRAGIKKGLNKGHQSIQVVPTESNFMIGGIIKESKILVLIKRYPICNFHIQHSTEFNLFLYFAGLDAYGSGSQ